MDAIAAGVIAAVVLAIVVSFLLGSIPFGYLIGRIFYRSDLRQSGSGNIGAMNALRTYGKGVAVVVLLLDAAKGFIPVWFLIWFLTRPIDLHSDSTFIVAHGFGLAALCGIAVVLGHCFSPWLGWKGGKGVATSFGVIAAMSWPALLVVLVSYVLGAFVFSRYSSVGSILSNAAAPFALYGFTHQLAYAVYGFFVALLIVWTHRENIARLRAGTEGPLNLFRR